MGFGEISIVVVVVLGVGYGMRMVPGGRIGGSSLVVTLAVAGCLASAGSGAGPHGPGTAGDAPASDLTINAEAPPGLNPEDLGRPYSSNFEPLIGPEGKSLFPAAGRPKNAEASLFTNYFTVINNSHELRANAHAWGIVSAGGSVGETTRHAAYRAVQITDVREVDDATPLRGVSGDAAYYIRRIYYGRLYEVVISGEATEFTAGARAEFLVWGGSISGFASKYQLNTQINAKGLRPKATALFARSADEVRSSYVEDPTYNAGNPVPILVEYRRIPNSAIKDFKTYTWSEGQAKPRQRIVWRHLSVDSRNNDWQSSGISMNDNDVIIVTASGTIDLNGKGMMVGPDTKFCPQQGGELRIGHGALKMKVGPHYEQYVGKKAVLISDQKNAEVKFRIWDSEYADNTGNYEVDIMYIPAALLPASPSPRTSTRDGTAP